MRVVEVFGPTVQGEGPYAGRVCHFLRFGGCDYRCSWCDTPYAVEPAQVRAAENLTPGEIINRLDDLAPAPMLVISGGNPALQRLDALIPELRESYAVLAVETQGSVWRDWLAGVDSLVVSPKPPSSGEATVGNWHSFADFMEASEGVAGRVLKIVVFDGGDLRWALDVHECYRGVPLYLSAGTDVGGTGGYEATVAGVGARYARLCEAVTAEPRLHAAIVLPQLHVIAWGHAVGV